MRFLVVSFVQSIVFLGFSFLLSPDDAPDEFDPEACERLFVWDLFCDWAPRKV